MDKMIAYISGPISGLTNGNVENFNIAQRTLEKEGYIVINPHEIGIELYQKWSKVNEPDQHELWIDFMRLDIRHLTLCSCLFLLDGWETSRGSLMELFIAQKLRMPIWHFKNRMPFETDLNIVKGRLVL